MEQNIGPGLWLSSGWQFPGKASTVIAVKVLEKHEEDFKEDKDRMHPGALYGF